MSSSPFESIKHTNELDQEFWLARELSDQLGYKSYANFVNVIEKARKACEQSGQRPEDHFQGFDDYIEQQNGIYKKIWNIRLSRYACYLVTQNADSRKSMVALGQSYFAMQTRMQELQAQHLEDQKRVMLRDEIKKHNKDLAKTARRA
jgi:DNA-damage-inducible protein D